jgi:hypothetical protein
MQTRTTHSKYLSKFIDWLTTNGYEGYDPYAVKGLLGNIPLISKIFPFVNNSNNASVKRAVLKFFRKYKVLDPKTLANCLEAYIYLFEKTREKKYFAEAKKLANTLLKKATKVDNCYSWGHPFSWETIIPKIFFYYRWKPDESSVIISSLIGHSLLDFYEISKDKIYLNAINKICQFILKSGYDEISRDSICFWYISKIKKLHMHNANVYAASLLQRVSNINKNKLYSDIAKKAFNYTIKNQLENGAWYYFGPPESYGNQKIDNYHTGFVLIALRQYYNLTKDIDSLHALKKGLKFYTSMFSPRGEPFYAPGVQYPMDVHNAALGIIAFAQNSDLVKSGKSTSKKILNWSVTEMQSEKGFFFYRKYKDGCVDKSAYPRWVESWMFRAMAISL